MLSRPPDLDQLRVFLTVVEQGSFSAAARTLGRAQSAVTYAIQELEGDLRLGLFDRSGYRPELSDAGRALLPRARRVLSEAGALRRQADGIGSGLEPEITIVVDPNFPMTALTTAFGEFEERFPSVTTQLYVEPLSAPVDWVGKGAAHLCLAVAAFADGDELERRHAGWLDLAPVCAPGHPLAVKQADGEEYLAQDDLADHLQLVLTDRAALRSGRDHGVSSARTWRLADLGAKRAMLIAGIGWGSLPRHMIADDIAAGQLIELRLERWAGSGALPRIELVVAKHVDRALGPAATWLFARLTMEP